MNPADKFATPRLAAGVLFAKQSRILLVRKTYGNRWDIPGGYVDSGESPASACERELHEELGLTRKVQRLLVHDWAPNGSEGDKILYIFDCGDLGDDENQIKVDNREIERFEWVDIDKIEGLVIPRLARRLAKAYRARQESLTLFLEHGEVRP